MIKQCPKCQSKRIFYTDTLYLASVRVCPFDESGNMDRSQLETVDVQEYVGTRFVKCSDCDWSIKVHKGDLYSIKT